MATGDVEDGIRARVRQLRFERGISLRALAAATGLSAATLSRIEGGERRLTVAQLGAVADGLGTTLRGLLGFEDGRNGPSEARDGRLWQPVGPERSEGRRVYRIEVPASAEPNLHSHHGHQWLYVLEGRLRLVVEDDDRVLVRGEAAEFDTWRAHWLAGVDGPADILAIFSEQGDPLRPVAVGARPGR